MGPNDKVNQVAWCPHSWYLKRHCQGEFAVFWPKLLKYLTKNPFSNMKLLIERREENIKAFIRERTSYNQFLATSLQYTERIWKKKTKQNILFTLKSILTIRSQT